MSTSGRLLHWYIVALGPFFLPASMRAGCVYSPGFHKKGSSLFSWLPREGKVYSPSFHKRGPSLLSWLPLEMAKFILPASTREIFQMTTSFDNGGIFEGGTHSQRMTSEADPQTRQLPFDTLWTLDIKTTAILDEIRPCLILFS